MILAKSGFEKLKLGFMVSAVAPPFGSDGFASFLVAAPPFIPLTGPRGVLEAPVSPE